MYCEECEHCNEEQTNHLTDEEFDAIKDRIVLLKSMLFEQVSTLHSLNANLENQKRKLRESNSCQHEESETRSYGVYCIWCGENTEEWFDDDCE